jgi:hypothetical protein
MARRSVGSHKNATDPAFSVMRPVIGRGSRGAIRRTVNLTPPESCSG